MNGKTYIQIKSLFLGGLYLICCCSFSNISGPNGIKIIALKTDFKAVPGKVLNTFIQIENNTGTLQKLKPFSNLPEGWQIFSDKKAITLAAGTKKSILLSFQISPNALAETYQLDYLLQSLTEESLKGKCQLTIEVEGVVKILLEPIASINAT